MRIEKEDISPVEKKVTVTIPRESVRNEIDAAYRDLGKRVKIKGFRQGKVPRTVLARHYKEQVKGEVVTKLVNDSYLQVLKENKITPVSQPLIENEDLEEEKDFTYSARIEVNPEIEANGYTGLTLEKEKLDVRKEDIDNKLEEIQQSHAQIREKEGSLPVQRGDFIVIDSEGFLNEKPIEGEKVTGHLLEVGTGSFFPELEEHFLGLNKDQEKDIKITFPEDYYKKNLAGKEATYRVQVKGIKEKIVSELNDDFAKDLGEFETLDELKEKIKETLEKQRKFRIESNLKEQVFDKLIEANSFQVPPSLVNQHLQYMLQETQMRLAVQGLTMEKVGLSPESFAGEYKNRAEKEVQCSFILADIAKKESIEVKEKEIDEKIVEMANNTGQNVETVRNYYRKNNGIDRLREELLTDKTLDFIIQKAKIEEKREKK